MKIKNLILIATMGVMSLMATGCFVKPYAVPELVTIEPSQTAFLVPLVGDTTDQATLSSESFLDSKKVATKQIEIPKRWFQTGRQPGDGKWIPSMRLIIVDRKPESREWTQTPGTGTGESNQAFSAETSDSNGFLAEMTCNAQIDESDATRFLYRFNTKSLQQVLDQDVRHMVGSRFSEIVAKYRPEEYLKNRQAIMDTVRGQVIPYFKERGVNITVLGLIGNTTWENKDIQTALDSRLVAEQERIAAQQKQQQAIAEAQSQAKVAQLKVTTQGVANQNIEIRKMYAEAALEFAKNFHPTTFVGDASKLNFFNPIPGMNAGK